MHKGLPVIRTQRKSRLFEDVDILSDKSPGPRMYATHQDLKVFIWNHGAIGQLQQQVFVCYGVFFA